MERIAKYMVIPLEIWQAADLSWSEKILLAEIDSYTSEGRDCYISNEYISELLGVKEQTASQLVVCLIRKGYVKQTRFDGRRRYLESMIKTTGRVSEKSQADYEKNHRQTMKKIRASYMTNISTKTFTIPSIDEVRAYCEERNNGIDPSAFIDHYTSNGWMVGRTKMKDWKAAVRNWERKHPKGAGNASQVAQDINDYWK